ncbi:MAG: MoaD/ThiS family protein [Acidimicrobiales bacterium]
MARVRFFAQARDAAGCAGISVSGRTVGDVLQGTIDQLGPSLGKVIESSAIWLNGEFATRNDPVSDADEVAVLPPVSGG